MYHSRPGPLLALSRLAAAAGTLFIACPALVHAQAVTAGGDQPGDISPQKTESITITAPRFINLEATGATKLPLRIIDTPQSISMLGSDLVRATNAQNIGQLAEYATGLVRQGTYYGSYSAVKSRGFVLEEDFGYRVNGNRFSYRYDFDPAIIETTEVIRGPSSVVYGIGNPGGLVNFVLKDPRPAPGGLASFGLGRWNERRASLQVNAPLNADGSLAGMIVASGDQSDSQVNFVERNSRTLYGAIKYDADAVRLSLKSGYTDRRSVTFDGVPLFADGRAPDVPRSLFLGSPEDNRYRTEAGFVLGEATYISGPLQTTFALSHQKQTNRLGLVYPFGLADDGATEIFGFEQHQPLTVTNVELRTQYSFDFMGQRDNAILASVVFDRSKEDGRFRLADFDGSGAAAVNVFDTQASIITATGRANFVDPWFDDLRIKRQTVLGVQAVLKPTPALTTVLGVSYNKPETELGNEKFDFGSRTSLRIGGVYALSPGLNVYAAFNQSFTPQTRVDTNFRPLKPLEGDQFELGVKTTLAGGQLLLSSAIYEIRQKNAGVLIAGTVPEQYAALGEVRHRGVEFEAIGRLAPNWSIFAGADFIDPTVTASEDASEVGRKRPYIPRYKTSLFSTYTILSGAARGLTLGGGFSHTGRQNTSLDGSSQQLPAYTVVDLMAEYTLSSYTVRFNLNNIFDEKYLLSTYNSTSLGHHFGEARRASMSLSYRW